MVSLCSLSFIVAVIILLHEPCPSTAQPTYCIGRSKEQCYELRPGTPEYTQTLHGYCPPIRSIEGSCSSNREDGVAKVWGVARTAHFSYFEPFSNTIATGQRRESARLASNLLSSQTSDVLNDRGMTEFLVFFGQILDHSSIQTAINEDEPLNIPIPPNDAVFDNFTAGFLRFDRSKRAKVDTDTTQERPMNLLSSAVDLAAVYSSYEPRLAKLRVSNHSCFLKTSKEDLLPRNVARLVNDPTPSRKFFLGGDTRSNENPILTALQTVFLREHNRLCEELEGAAVQRGLGDLFETARAINIAQFQKIAFEEFYPAITGRRLVKYKGFREDVNLGISVLFSTAAFRIGHTMTGNEMKLRGRRNRWLGSLSPTEMFFREATVFERVGPEPFLRGAIAAQAQEVDTLVHDSLRQILFANVAILKDGIDLVALNLQRGRDHALPPYNTVRKKFGLPKLHSFRQVTSNRALQSRLSTVYHRVDDMDIWIALLAEDHEAGSSMGPTMLRIWEAEFTRLRNGDRFFYERRGHFSASVLKAIPRLRALRREENTMRRILLRNTEIADNELPDSVFIGSKKPKTPKPRRPKTPKPRRPKTSKPRGPKKPKPETHPYPY